MSTPEVSILMRCYNEMPHARRTLESLLAQEGVQWELLLADSSSSDGSFELLSPYASFVYRHQPSEYRPGVSLNILADNARAPFFVMLNADCIPLSATWLRDMVAELKDAHVVWARQVARSGAFAQVVRDYEYAFPQSDAFATGKLPDTSFSNMFSMAASGVRQSIWREHPFPEELQFSEDIAWAYHLRGIGLEVRYAPLLAVEHSHNYSFRQAFKRFRGEGQADVEIFGVAALPRQRIARAMLRAGAACVRDAMYCWKNKRLRELPRSIWLRIGQHYGRTLGQSLGVRASR